MRNITTRLPVLPCSIIICCVLAQCNEPASPPPPLAMLETPAPAPSAEPNLTLSPAGEIYLSWIARQNDGAAALQFSRLQGRQWMPPRTIAAGTDWFVNWADFPALAVLDDGRMAAHYLAKSGQSTYAYDVRITTSTDEGETWRDAFTPHLDRTETEHGFVSLLPWRGDAFFATWLDGRNTAAGGHDNDGEHGGGAMTLRAAFFDTEGNLFSETELDNRTCDCCQTAAVETSNGALLVAYRDRSEDEIRDISVVRYENQEWSAPVRVHEDAWQIPGCPVNGPALDEAEGQIALAWFTAPDENRQVLAAFSADGGRSFDQPIRIDDGDPLGRVDVLSMPGGAMLVSWLEQTEEGAEIRLRRLDANHTDVPIASQSLTVARTSPARQSGFPRMISNEDIVVLAWTQVLGESETKVQTAYYEVRALYQALADR